MAGDERTSNVRMRVPVKKRFSHQMTRNYGARLRNTIFWLSSRPLEGRVIHRVAGNDSFSW